MLTISIDYLRTEIEYVPETGLLTWKKTSKNKVRQRGSGCARRLPRGAAGRLDAKPALPPFAGVGSLIYRRGLSPRPPPLPCARRAQEPHYQRLGGSM